MSAGRSESCCSKRSVEPRLFLEKAVDFEPVGTTPVTRPALGHANEEALAQAARLARRPVLFVDHALAAVLALADSRHVAVRPAEK